MHSHQEAKEQEEVTLLQQATMGRASRQSRLKRGKLGPETAEHDESVTIVFEFDFMIFENLDSN